MSDTLVWIAGITQAITAVVAVGALAVSIYSLYLQRRDKSPQLRVRGSIGDLMDPDFNPVEHVYMITVVNHSTAPLTVTQLYKLYIWHRPDQKLAVPNMTGEKPLPCKLDPWEGRSW
jgi:hypothetical protein